MILGEYPKHDITSKGAPKVTNWRPQGPKKSNGSTMRPQECLNQFAIVKMNVFLFYIFVKSSNFTRRF